MRVLCSTLLFALMIVTAAAQSSQFGFKKDHDALLVEDLDASAKFYRSVLGLEEIQNAGLPDDIRWFQLDNGVQLHLIESKEIPSTPKGLHMSLSTDKLTEFMEFLRSENISFENWPGEINTTNTRPDGVLQIYLQDPDGYWIEINDNR